MWLFYNVNDNLKPVYADAIFRNKHTVNFHHLCYKMLIKSSIQSSQAKTITSF